jgi:hypothetical protein
VKKASCSSGGERAAAQPLCRVDRHQVEKEQEKASRVANRPNRTPDEVYFRELAASTPIAESLVIISV